MLDGSQDKVRRLVRPESGKGAALCVVGLRACCEMPPFGRTLVRDWEPVGEVIENRRKYPIEVIVNLPKWRRADDMCMAILTCARFSSTLRQIAARIRK